MYRETILVSTFCLRGLVGCIGASMVVGWQRRVPIRKGARVDSNLVG